MQQKLTFGNGLNADALSSGFDLDSCSVSACSAHVAVSSIGFDNHHSFGGGEPAMPGALVFKGRPFVWTQRDANPSHLLFLGSTATSDKQER